MNIFSTGLVWPSMTTLNRTTSLSEFSSALLSGIGASQTELFALSARSGSAAQVFRDRPPVPLALDDPAAAGWRVLINPTDPRAADLVAAIKPLAEAYGASSEPLLYEGKATAWDWIERVFLPMEDRPYYVLILADPESVPFGLQAALGVCAAVGRLDFDLPEQLDVYVEKLLRHRRGEMSTQARAVFFAPDADRDDDGDYDVTYYSRRYMADPLANFTKDRLQFEVDRYMGSDATVANLLEYWAHDNPSLCYSASHGLAAVDQPTEVQMAYNGSVVAQGEEILHAELVPIDRPVMPGGVYFQFACHGYGTPAISDYSHWLPQVGLPRQYAARSFVAALPKRLLANPLGPIAYIGHVDDAFLSGFAYDEAPELAELLPDRYHDRLHPYRNACVELLRNSRPVGLALRSFRDKYSTLNGTLTTLRDDIARGFLPASVRMELALAEAFIRRADAQNFLLLGDPGARLRIEE